MQVPSNEDVNKYSLETLCLTSFKICMLIAGKLAVIYFSRSKSENINIHEFKMLFIALLLVIGCGGP